MSRNKRTYARMHKKRIDRSAIKRTRPAIERTCVWRPIQPQHYFGNFCFIKVLLILVAQGLNPTIFRVSRFSLDSINRPVNTEKHTWFWRRIDGSQGSNFSGFILFLYFILWRWLASISCVTKPFSRSWLKPWSCLLSNSILAPLR